MGGDASWLYPRPFFSSVLFNDLTLPEKRDQRPNPSEKTFFCYSQGPLIETPVPPFFKLFIYLCANVIDSVLSYYI